MRRGVVLASLPCLLLASCSGGERDPLVESRIPPTLGERFYPPEGWAWSVIQVGGAPPQRYGVSAPTGAPRAQVLILPDYGETAETWFETARDLNEAGFTVWVLEGAGQGGSGRLAGPRDLGHVESFDPDVAAVRAMIRTVIRAPVRQPLVVLGQGVGATIAAQAAEDGIMPDGLVLSAPRLRPIPGEDAPLMRALGLGALRAPGGGGWRADAGPTPSTDRWRGEVTRLWQAANPALRMGGPSLDWMAAFAGAADQTRRDLNRIAAPTLVVEGAGAGGCRAIPACTAITVPAAGSALELQPDARRAVWLSAIETFVRQRVAAQSEPLPKPRPRL